MSRSSTTSAAKKVSPRRAESPTPSADAPVTEVLPVEAPPCNCAAHAVDVLRNPSMILHPEDASFGDLVLAAFRGVDNSDAVSGMLLHIRDSLAILSYALDGGEGVREAYVLEPHISRLSGLAGAAAEIARRTRPTVGGAS